MNHTSETLLRSRVFNVERRTYVQPDGSTIVRDVVVHPGAVVILPRLDDNRLVMLRNLRRATGAELWELPAGTMEPGEAPIDTAGRELEEETGYAAREIVPFIEFFATPGFCTEKMHCFIASALTATRQRLEHGEQIRVEIVDTQWARRAILDGTIQDGKTIAVLGAYFLGGQP